MATNFFRGIAALPASPNSEWVIVIKQIEKQMIVSVLYKDESCGDTARTIIPTLNFNDNAQKLDECFFADLLTAITGTVEVHNNMEHYLKEQEAAKLQSKMEKDKENQTKPKKEKNSEESPKTEKEKKYDNALKQAAELEADGKYQEAWMKVPEPGDYPEQAEFLRHRREELSAHFLPNLFS